MRIFLTADQHWFHKRIFELAPRPFTDVETMGKSMIAEWNAVVGLRDTVHHLGDISFGDIGETLGIIGALNGNIKLIPGNHDRWLEDYNEELGEKLILMPQVYRLKFNKTKIWLSHFPLRAWDGSFRGAMSVYGHTHGEIESQRLPRSMDVGVDAIGFRPLYIGDVWARLDKEPIIPEEARIRGDEDAKLLAKSWKLWKKAWTK